MFYRAWSIHTYWFLPPVQLNNGQFFIKRIVGVPGDKVFYENGILYINDQKIEQAPLEASRDFQAVRDFELPGGKSDYLDLEEKLGEEPHETLLRREEIHFRCIGNWVRWRVGVENYTHRTAYFLRGCMIRWFPFQR